LAGRPGSSCEFLESVNVTLSGEAILVAKSYVKPLDGAVQGAYIDPIVGGDGACSSSEKPYYRLSPSGLGIPIGKTLTTEPARAVIGGFGRHQSEDNSKQFGVCCQLVKRLYTSGLTRGTSTILTNRRSSGAFFSWRLLPDDDIVLAFEDVGLLLTIGVSG